MFEFNAENLDPLWQKDKHQIDSSTWESSELRIKPLSDTPFDFFQQQDQHEETRTVLSEITNSTATTTTTQPEYMDEDDIWTTSPTLPKFTHTLTWDSFKPKIATPFITETPTHVFDTVIRHNDTTSFVIYETDLVHYLIQAIHGIPSIYFYWDNYHQLQRYKHMRILGVSTSCIEPVIDRLLLFATQLKALDRLGQQYRTGMCGSTGMAFGSCLIEFHLNIQYTMMNEITATTTILQLQQWMEHLFSIVHRLHELCQPGLPFGAAILNLLYEELKPLDLILDGSCGLYRDVLFCFLEYTSVPYMNMLSQWLNLDNLELQDPYKEFFIQPNQDTNEYEIQSDIQLPYFVHQEMATYILKSGVSLQLLKKNKPSHLLFQLDNSISLRLLADTNEGEEYIQKLKSICESIRMHNDDESIRRINTSIAEPDNMNEDSNESDICSIPALNKDILRDKEFSNKLKEIITNQHKEMIPSIDIITQQSYIQPLEIWCPLLNESLMKSIFLNKHQLEYHLSILYQFYLLGNGQFSRGLEEILLSEADGSPNLALKDLVIECSNMKEDEYIQLTFSKDRTNLNLKYAVPYPFDILITKQVMEKYDRIFTFLVEICKLNAMMRKTYGILAELKNPQIHKYRFELAHFITEFTTYIKSSIIESTWHPFIKDLEKQDMMQFSEYQDIILDCILYPCLLKKGQTKISQVLQPILTDISLFYQVVVSAQHHPEKIELKCRRIYEQFKVHTNIFVKVLELLETKGSGRLSNILTHHKHLHSLDVFAKDLYMRLNMNDFYQ